jgi:hypothetical protein
MIQAEFLPLFEVLIKTYGLSGILAGLGVFFYLRQNKRIMELEKRNDIAATQNVEMHRDLVENYVQLVNKNTQVIERLTACINGIKETMDRIERKTEIK